MYEESKPKEFPPEQQERPGIEEEMIIKPEYIRENYKGSNKLEGKITLITGGDSGIGRSIAVHFAREGADIAISYLPEEQEDADETKKLVEKEGKKCLLLPGDLRDKNYCTSIVEKTVDEYGKLNILINNAAIQIYNPEFTELKDEDIIDTFNINIISMFRITKAALKYLQEGDSIIFSTSINAFKGNATLVDYTSTKGAILALSRSLALQLADKKIRVNAVAPGPIWTPLIVSCFPKDKVKNFGKDTTMKRAGQPSECGPCYVFLASEDSSYITGQCLHPNGGSVLNT